MKVYVVWYFDDMNWCVDGVFRNYEDANKQVDENKRMGHDSYLDDMELK